MKDRVSTFASFGWNTGTLSNLFTLESSLKSVLLNTQSSKISGRFADTVKNAIGARTIVGMVPTKGAMLVAGARNSSGLKDQIGPFVYTGAPKIIIANPQKETVRNRAAMMIEGPKAKEGARRKVGAKIMEGARISR